MDTCTNIFDLDVGELYLEEMSEESDCIGPWQWSSCGWKVCYSFSILLNLKYWAQAAWLIPLLLSLYILVTNILLVNLLSTCHDTER